MVACLYLPSTGWFCHPWHWHVGDLFPQSGSVEWFSVITLLAPVEPGFLSASYTLPILSFWLLDHLLSQSHIGCVFSYSYNCVLGIIRHFGVPFSQLSDFVLLLEHI